jgi:Flp pilus assembly protein TadG
MRRFRTSSIRRDKTATTALEMALVLPVLLTILLGGLEIGLMWWTDGTLQSVAALTARCASIGTTACSDPAAYAASMARTWLPTVTIVTSAEATQSSPANFTVTVATATTCKGATGTFKTVTISASTWAGVILYPLRGGTDTLTACYPT